MIFLGQSACGWQEDSNIKKRVASPPVTYRGEKCPQTDSPPPRLDFSEDTGPTIQMPPDAQPVDFFHHLFDDSVLQLIVDETNK